MSYSEYFAQSPIEIQISSDALSSVYDVLQKCAEKATDVRHLLGEMTATGEIPQEYTLKIDPGLVQYIFHPNDSSVTVQEADLIYNSPTQYDPYTEDAMKVSAVCVRLKSQLSARPEVVVHEYFTILKHGSDEYIASAESEYSDQEGAILGQTFLERMENAWCDDLLNELENPEGSIKRSFGIDEFENFTLLAEMLAETPSVAK